MDEGVWPEATWDYKPARQRLRERPGNMSCWKEDFEFDIKIKGLNK